MIRRGLSTPPPLARRHPASRKEAAVEQRTQPHHTPKPPHNGQPYPVAVTGEHQESFLARVSRWATEWTGSSTAFVLAVLSIVVWLVTGPYCEYSDPWQLVINTGTTIVTF